MGVRLFVLDDVIPNEFSHHKEAGCLHPLRFPDQDSNRFEVNPASEVPETTVLLFRIVSIDHIIAFFNFLKEFRQLGRTGLQIVVHGDDVISFGVIHSRNRRVVLTGILRQLDGLYAGILIGQCLQLLKGCPFVR